MSSSSGNLWPSMRSSTNRRSHFGRCGMNSSALHSKTQHTTNAGTDEIRNSILEASRKFEACESRWVAGEVEFNATTEGCLEGPLGKRDGLTCRDQSSARIIGWTNRDRTATVLRPYKNRFLYILDLLIVRAREKSQAEVGAQP